MKNSMPYDDDLNETNHSLKDSICQTTHKKETDNLKRPISIKETELVMNNLPRLKALGPRWFTNALYQTFKEKSHQHFTISFRA